MAPAFIVKIELYSKFQAKMTKTNAHKKTIMDTILISHVKLPPKTKKNSNKLQKLNNLLKRTSKKIQKRLHKLRKQN